MKKYLFKLGNYMLNFLEGILAVIAGVVIGTGLVIHHIPFVSKQLEKTHPDIAMGSISVMGLMFWVVVTIGIIIYHFC